MSKAAELAALIGSGQAQGDRNLIINGAMQVAQRGTSTTGLQNTGGVYTIDRFAHRRGGTWSNAVFKHEQVAAVVTGETGLNKALKVTCTTAEGSVPASGEAVAIGCSYLEKGDTNRLGVGTSTALTSTFSFYVRASIATTYGFEIHGQQHSTTQAIRIPFTISSTNTWERISVSIPADTAALDSDADNTQGWSINVVLDGVASSDTASAWASLGSSGVSLPNGVSTTTFSNTLNATFEITGVQLEVGDVATPFEHRSFGDELFSCQRYFSHAVTCIGPASSGSLIQAFASLPKQMRAAPSYSVSGALNFSDGYAADFVQSSGAVAIVANAAPDGSPAQFLNFTNFSGLSAGEIMFFPRNSANNNRIIADAEL